MSAWVRIRTVAPSSTALRLSTELLPGWGRRYRAIVGSRGVGIRGRVAGPGGELPGTVDACRIEKLVIAEVRIRYPITLHGHDGARLQTFPIVSHGIASGRSNAFSDPAAYVRCGICHGCRYNRRDYERDQKTQQIEGTACGAANRAAHRDSGKIAENGTRNGTNNCADQRSYLRAAGRLA